jgi:hypothetical protein
MATDAPGTTRRGLLQWAVATAAATSGYSASGVGPATSPSEIDPATIRDRLWIWTHPAGAYKLDFGLPRTSRMTPVEGAVYLGVPNLLFIRYEGNPPMPFDQYALSFRPLKRVVWSLVGASGKSSEEERRHVLDLATRFPNIVGFIMDDYFHPDGTGSLSVEELKELRRRLTIAGKKRDLFVVVYQHQLALPIQAHLESCDKITFWTWEARDLKTLESAFDRLEKLAPRHGKLLGCYLWDFGTGKPMPLDLMKKQCALGRQLLEQGRIEGMIFLASNVCDLDLETVEWSRKWIADVGQRRLDPAVNR